MTQESPYSALDRMIHRLAFASPAVQATAADIEAMLYGSRFKRIPIERPVFVTSLPRAGTTLVLEVLSRVTGIATHNYRDMPFVLAPILWDTMCGAFHKPSDLRERAHGDGMTVGYDSPEAFEEVLWRSFWPGKYASDRIAIWTEHEDVSEFRPAFQDHIRKIIALRTGGSAGARYASKNNANIARIGLLRTLFHDGIILVPIRDPVAQAVSLLRQHRRFAALHAEDAFARQYMDDIGHLEFGALHRPIDFEGMDEARRRYRADTLDYWVAYWECAFRHVLRHRGDIVLVSYEALCDEGPAVMRALAERLAIPADALMTALGDRMRAPRELGSDATIEDSDLAHRARDVHQTLLASCVPI